MAVTKAKRKSGVLVENIKTIVYAGLIAIGIRTLAYEPFNIPSGSMIPTLLVGDYLFVSKFSYGYSRFSLPFSPDLFSGRIFGRLPHRGDVAVFKYPRDDHHRLHQADRRAAGRSHPGQAGPALHQRRVGAAPAGGRLRHRRQRHPHGAAPVSRDAAGRGEATTS